MYFMPEWHTYVIPTMYNRGLDKCPQGIAPLHWPGHAALELFFGNILRIDDYPRLSLLGVRGVSSYVNLLSPYGYQGRKG